MVSFESINIEGQHQHMSKDSIIFLGLETLKSNAEVSYVHDGREHDPLVKKGLTIRNE